VEVSLMLPWILFLFIGVLDFGFYSYSIISVENAARVAAIYTSSSSPTDSTGACYYVLQELKNANNTHNLANCGGSPLSVTAAAATVNGVAASQVTVTYDSPTMIPIPGLLPGTYRVTRIVTMMQ
jgi:Flp pilus assembly protein TadG